jgi:cell division protein ZapD
MCLSKTLQYVTLPALGLIYFFANERKVSIYEFPFNERIRVLLRLEDLFSKATKNMSSDEACHHHNVLVSIFQIMDIIDRTDIRMDLLQELERQKTAMAQLQNNPKIDLNLLSPFIEEISQVIDKLRGMNARLGSKLKENEWLMAIKQRSIIPGGLCEFDLPAYHFWLDGDASKRKSDLRLWLEELVIMHDALSIVLKIIRGSSHISQATASKGSFQQLLGGAKTAQMLIVELPSMANYFPEISANKYAINIRFMQMDEVGQVTPFEEDVPFKLILGHL